MIRDIDKVIDHLEHGGSYVMQHDVRTNSVNFYLQDGSEINLSMYEMMSAEPGKWRHLHSLLRRSSDEVAA